MDNPQETKNSNEFIGSSETTRYAPIFLIVTLDNKTIGWRYSPTII